MGFCQKTKITKECVFISWTGFPWLWQVHQFAGQKAGESVGIGMAQFPFWQKISVFAQGVFELMGVSYPEYGQVLFSFRPTGSSCATIFHYMSTHFSMNEQTTGDLSIRYRRPSEEAKTLRRKIFSQKNHPGLQHCNLVPCVSTNAYLGASKVGSLFPLVFLIRHSSYYQNIVGRISATE